MNEFVRRLSAEGVSVFSAHLIRRAWLEQFGFAFNPRYAGVVVSLPGIQSSGL